MEEKTVRKLITGAVCAAAIGAAAVVLLPVAAVKIAVRLSKPRDKARTAERPEKSSPSPKVLQPHGMQG